MKEKLDLIFKALALLVLGLAAFTYFESRDVGRYAYLVLPAGRSLDLNYIHNQAKRGQPTYNSYMRNQGVGSWELNLAAFLVLALACHGELARRRPAPQHLTAFYMWMSAGGVIGVGAAPIDSGLVVGAQGAFTITLPQIGGSPANYLVSITGTP